MEACYNGCKEASSADKHAHKEGDSASRMPRTDLTGDVVWP